MCFSKEKLSQLRELDAHCSYDSRTDFFDVGYGVYGWLVPDLLYFNTHIDRFLDTDRYVSHLGFVHDLAHAKAKATKFYKTYKNKGYCDCVVFRYKGKYYFRCFAPSALSVWFEFHPWS